MGDGSGSFFQFQQLCDKILGENSHNSKTKIIKDFIESPSWSGDLFLLCKLLIIKDDQRVFHLREKTLTKHLATILKVPHQDLLMDLQKGDVAATASSFFENHGKPKSNSVLTLRQVDRWLDKLSNLTKEEEQLPHLSSLLTVATPRDLNFVCRLIDKDLNINIGAKFVLQAFHPQAFDAYRNTHNLAAVVDKVQTHQLDEEAPKKAGKKTGGGAKKEAFGSDDEEESKPKLKTGLSIGLSLGTPIKPMLARACKSFDEAWKRCPNGMFVEIKYDGERVQVHKQGNKFLFFSRNLKPVKENKVDGLPELLAASTKANTCVLDGEVLVVDKVTLKMLPFGALGIHKQKQFPNAQLCFFIFDIMMLEGKSLMNLTYCERRQILVDHFQLVSGKLALSDATEVKTNDELQAIWKRVLTESLEGLMLKDKLDTYKPNQRHWLKLKKDYLAGMADSADLIILGAYYGTGNKGGLLTTYLGCVLDPKTKTFKTVCKVSGGLDDNKLAALQAPMMAAMTKINGSSAQLPAWLNVSKMHCPDWVAKDPKAAPIWEVEGTSFSISSNHTANGISIRFPRIARFRVDKDWTTATNLDELEDLAMQSPDFIAAREMKGLPAPASSSGTNAKKPAASKSITAAANVHMPGLFVTGDTSTLTAGKKMGNSGIRYMIGNITEALSDDVETKRLMVVTTDGAKWPADLESITQKWPNVIKAFDKNKNGMEPGSVILVKLATPESAVLRLGVVVCVNPHSHAFSIGDFKNALDELASFAVGDCVKSVHFVWPAEMTGIAWSMIESAIQARLITKEKLEVIVYSANPITGVIWKPKPKKKGLIVYVSEDDEGSGGDEEDEAEYILVPPGGGIGATEESDEESIEADGVPPSFSTDPEDIFSDKSILSYGDMPELGELRATIMADGGWFGDATRLTNVNIKAYTHVITHGDWDEKLESWLKQNPTIKAVRPAWVFDSSTKGKSVYEKPYFVPRNK